MTANAELAIHIRARDESTGVINRIKGSLGGIGGAAKTAAVGLGIATAGVGALAFAGFSFAKAAAEEQASVERLNQSIKNLGGNTEAMVGQSEKAIKAAERLAFSDDEARSGLALLVAQTGDYADAQNRLTVAQNLSRGANLDLETASRLVGKITEENVQVLKRYGITLREGATEQEALAEIQKRFGGQAEAFAKTGAGGWQRFNNELQNVKESIGVGLLPLFSKASTALADFMVAHQADVERISVLIGVKLAGAIEGVVAFLIQHKGTIKAFFDNFRTGLETMKPVVEYILTNKVTLVAAILAIGVAIAFALGPVSAAALAITGIILLIGYLRNNWRDVLDYMKDHLQEFFVVATVILGPFGLPLLIAGISMNAFGMRDALKAALDAVVGFFESLPGRILAALGDLGHILFDAGKDLIKGFIDGMKSIPIPNPLDMIPGGGIIKGAGSAVGGFFGGVFHGGGIVPGPIGAPRLIMAEAGERVLTQAQQRQGSGAGVTMPITVNIYADTTPETIEKLRRAIADGAADGLRRTGLQGSIIGAGSFSV